MPTKKGRKTDWMIGNTNGFIHGMTGTKTYNSWVAMISRCTRPENKRYKNYGGRGIKVCERWMKFINFYTDMGERPKGKTLDRIDVNGNYEPSNCRWASSDIQYSNMSKNNLITFRGITKTVSQWARDFGTTNTGIYYHLNNKGLEFMYQWRVIHNKKVPTI